jgi:hypothetical protein
MSLTLYLLSQALLSRLSIKTLSQALLSSSTLKIFSRSLLSSSFSTISIFVLIEACFKPIKQNVTMLPAFIILGIVSLVAIRTDHHRHPENPGSLTTAGRIGAGVALAGAYVHCARLLAPQPEHEVPLSFVPPPVSVIIPSTSTIASGPTVSASNTKACGSDTF